MVLCCACFEPIPRSHTINVAHLTHSSSSSIDTTFNVLQLWRGLGRGASRRRTDALRVLYHRRHMCKFHVKNVRFYLIYIFSTSKLNLENFILSLFFGPKLRESTQKQQQCCCCWSSVISWHRWYNKITSTAAFKAKHIKNNH